MLNIDDYVKKYIDFYNNDLFNGLTGKKEIENIGHLCYSFDTQSIKQETSHCFNAYFMGENSFYHFSRVSYGIINDTCYIYAVQNKHKNIDNEYSILVTKALNTLNSGVKNIVM